MTGCSRIWQLFDKRNSHNGVIIIYGRWWEGGGKDLGKCDGLISFTPSPPPNRMPSDFCPPYWICTILLLFIGSGNIHKCIKIVKCWLNDCGSMNTLHQKINNIILSHLCQYNAVVGHYWQFDFDPPSFQRLLDFFPPPPLQSEGPWFLSPLCLNFPPLPLLEIMLAPKVSV